MFDISEVNKIFRTTEQRLIYLHKYEFHQFGKKRCINEIDLERWLWWLIIMEKLIFKILQMHLYINIEYHCWFILLYAIYNFIQIFQKYILLVINKKKSHVCIFWWLKKEFHWKVYNKNFGVYFSNINFNTFPSQWVWLIVSYRPKYTLRSWLFQTPN